jgi:hypothetical protein
VELLVLLSDEAFLAFCFVGRVAIKRHVATYANSPHDMTVYDHLNIGDIPLGWPAPH